MVLGIITLIIVAFAIIWIIVKVKEYKKEIALQSELIAERMKAKTSMLLQQINHSYMLGLPNLSQMVFISPETKAFQARILESDNPLSAFAKEVKPGKPNIGEFCLSMETMLNRLMKEMQLDEGDMSNIYVEFLSMTTAVTDELIDEIVQPYASSLPPQMHFLKDKVNYELACLGHIMQHGVDQNRQDICNKVDAIRKKRGYID